MVKSTLSRSLIGSAGLRVINMGLGFAVTIVLARTLGTTGFGIYSTAFVVASTCAIVVQFGLPNLIMRETAAAAVDEDWPRMAAVWGWATRNALLISAAIIVVAGGIIFLPQRGASSEQLWSYALAMAFVPLIALGSLRAGALKGLQQVVLAQVPELVVKPGAMLLMALTLGVLLPAKPNVAMAMQFAAVAMAFVVGAALLWLKRPSGIVRAEPPLCGVAMPSLRSVVAFALVAGAARINQYADILTISAFRSPEEVGVYRVVWQLSLLISFGTGIAAVIVAPLFARYHAQGDRAALFGALRRARLMGMAIALPPFLVVLFFGETVIGYLFGTEFTEGLSALILLALMQVTNAVAGPLGPFLSMTGRETISARIHMFAAGLNVVLNLVLVPSWGVTGAAMATFGSYLLLNALLGLTVYATKR